MYGKKLKDLDTKFIVKKVKSSFGIIKNISSQKEFSYKKINIKNLSKFELNEKNYYIYISSGSLLINNKEIHEGSLVFCPGLISINSIKNSEIYLFFFKKIDSLRIQKNSSKKKIKTYLKKISTKKKYWGEIIDLVNDKYGAIKIIYMKKNTQSSMEFHISKKENYFIEYGFIKLGLRYARAINGLINLKKNNSYLMKPGTIHMRMASENSKIIEMSTRDSDNDSIIVHDGKYYKFQVGKC